MNAFWEEAKKFCVESDLESSCRELIAAILVDLSNVLILGVTDAAAAKFGYSKAELEGKHINLLIPEKYRDDHNLLVEEYKKEPRNIRMGERKIPCLRKGGELFTSNVWLLHREETNQVLCVFL